MTEKVRTTEHPVIRRRKLILVLLLVTLNAALLAMVVGTSTYYAAASTLRNPFQVGSKTVYLQEVFDEDDKWLPGETKEKLVLFGNIGSVPQVLRFRIEPDSVSPTRWYESDGTTAWTPDVANPVTLNWTASLGSDWQQIGDWYYYKYPLAPGAQTPEVLQSLTFSPLLSNDRHADKDYSDKIYKLTIRVESLEVIPEATLAEWGRSFTGTTTLVWT